MNRRELIVSAAAAGGTALMAQPAAAAAGAADLTAPQSGQLLVAFVIGKFANVMDIAGPWEGLQDVGFENRTPPFPFNLVTVSDSKEPVGIGGSAGMAVIPNYTYDDIPQPNVIIMGAQQEHTDRKIAWIREAAPKADIVLSVCTGAFLLAKTGLLDGLRATTHHEFYDKFEHQFPRVQLVRGPRYVENGKFMTAGGLTSGIEIGLRVAERYFGSDAAKKSALYMEYNRSPKRPTV